MKSRRDLVRAEFGETMDHVRQAAAHAAGGLGAGVGPSLGSARDTARAARDSGKQRAMAAKVVSKTASARSLVGPAAGRMTGRMSSAASSGWDGALSAWAPLAEAARTGSAKAVKLDSKLTKNRKGNKMSFTTKESGSSGHTGLYTLLATGVVVGAAGAFVARRRTRAKWAAYEPSSLHSDASTFHNAGATSKPSLGTTESTTGDGTVTKATNWTMEHARSAVEAIRHKIHEASADHHAESAIDQVKPGTMEMKPNGAAGTRTSDSIEDEVDDLIRSAKNGHM